MTHFVAYHNSDKMGYSFPRRGEFSIFSNKSLTFLERTIGQTVWVVNGAEGESGKIYSLCGFYIPDQIVFSEGDFEHVICGSSGRHFASPIELNHFAWFPRFLALQTNFALGINKIMDPEAITRFSELAGADIVPATVLDDYDIDPSATEGGESYVLHLRRERNKGLIKSKKEKVLRESGKLSCEACGFDFRAAYGELGEGYCEVHHTAPLSSLAGQRVTNLGDLAILCSNCHRVIHRRTRIPTVQELREILNEARRKY